MSSLNHLHIAQAHSSSTNSLAWSPSSPNLPNQSNVGPINPIVEAAIVNTNFASYMSRYNHPVAMAILFLLHFLPPILLTWLTTSKMSVQMECQMPKMMLCPMPRMLSLKHKNNNNQNNSNSDIKNEFETVLPVKCSIKKCPKYLLEEMPMVVCTHDGFSCEVHSVVATILLL